MAFIIGKQQADIFAAFTEGSGHIQIAALAGCGKSTTAIEMMKRAPDGARMAIMAFNRDIKEDLEKKVPAGVMVSTLNGFGHRSLPRGHGRKLNSAKSNFVLQDIMGVDRNDARYRDFSQPVRKLVGIAKGNGLAFNGHGLAECTQKELLRLMAHHGIEGPEIRKGVTDDAGVATWARMVLRESIDHPRLIDFDDQLWLPIIKGWPIEKFDLLFVDEAQDLNPVQQELVSRALATDGRLVIIGDENQAIYGFRGADSASMSNMQRKFSATKLPLSITWRCATSIVERAQEIVPEFEAAPDAVAGEVREFPGVKEIDFEPTDMVVCRTNAPLVNAAFELLRRKIPFNFLGRDLGANLISTIKKVNGRSNRDIENFSRMLRLATDEKVARARKNDNESAAQTAMDIADSIDVFVEEADDVPELVYTIEEFFKAKLFQKSRVTLCTIHKSKGLEAPRVFILNYNMMPASWAKKPHDIQQEMNLKYVAITRAKHTLGIINAKKKKKREQFFDWESGGWAGGGEDEPRREAGLDEQLSRDPISMDAMRTLQKHHPQATSDEMAEAFGADVAFVGMPQVGCAKCNGVLPCSYCNPHLKGVGRES